MALNVHDSVALIAPASAQKKGDDVLVDNAVSTLESWGLKVKYFPKLDSPHYYLSASDEQRSMEINRALADEQVKAIFCTRGGYGFARILKDIDPRLAKSQKFLVGFSDICLLHLTCATNEKIQCIHGPNLATNQFQDSENRGRLYSYLFDKSASEFYADNHQAFLSLNKSAELQSISQLLKSSVFTGGCLSVIVGSLATKAEINTVNKILLLEDIAESPYKLDRLIMHLQNAGKFEQVKAVVFGDMHLCDSNQIRCFDIIRDIFQDADFPVYSNRYFGHGEKNFPWKYN